MAGEFSSYQQVSLHDMLLPEIGQDIALPELQACVFPASCRYDIILGHDTLRHFQIVLDLDNNIINSFEGISVFFPRFIPVYKELTRRFFIAHRIK